MIEHNFDIPFISGLALKEKQIQQNYRPLISIHKWFARRPGTLFRGLILSEFISAPLKEVYYRPSNLEHIQMADPFMGGGTPLMEANRLGCAVIGYDINPMSYWIVKQEIEQLELASYKKAANSLRKTLEKQIGQFYRTKCLKCGSDKAHVKCFLWVKEQSCKKCKKDFGLFPGYLIAENKRHTKNVFFCPNCNSLTETDDKFSNGSCETCGNPLNINGNAKRNRCTCPYCGENNSYPAQNMGPPKHKLFAMEYHCPICKPKHKGRFFKTPDAKDKEHLIEISNIWHKMRPRFIPTDSIPKGDETTRLHRWGYDKYHQMFNIRQKLGLELSCRIIEKQHDQRIKNALATNLSDLVRYQNMLCRYDKMALKSLNIFSVHGFPVGLIQCESNFLGILNHNRNICIGSGGWLNIIHKYVKAKSFCTKPFEIKRDGGRKSKVFIKGEWIGDSSSNQRLKKRSVSIVCADAADKELQDNSLDGVFTDPPYYGNVQYAELMDFCYVWLKQLLGKDVAAFQKKTTRDMAELTINENMGRDRFHFTEGLSSAFTKMAKALKPGAPLVFTYHHNKLSSYFPIAVAILDANLTCSASLPCPAEMGGSIYINGTGSSIIDTVFVCRFTGKMPGKWLAKDAYGLAKIVNADIHHLLQGNVKASKGDIRCITYGHLIRHAIWELRHGWEKDLPVNVRINKIAEWIDKFGKLSDIENYLKFHFSHIPTKQTSSAVHEKQNKYGVNDNEISF